MIVVQTFDETLKLFIQHNLEAVSDAYNDLLIREEDYKTLRDSIDSFDNLNNRPCQTPKKARTSRIPSIGRSSLHYKVCSVVYFLCLHLLNSTLLFFRKMVAGKSQELYHAEA